MLDGLICYSTSWTNVTNDSIRVSDESTPSFWPIDEAGVVDRIFGFRLSTYLVSVEIFQPCVTLERLSIIFWSPSINRRGNSGEKKVFERQKMPPSIQCTICKKMCYAHQKQMPVLPDIPPSILPLGASGDIWDFRLTGQRGSHVAKYFDIASQKTWPLISTKGSMGLIDSKTRWKTLWEPYFCWKEGYSSTKGSSSVTAVCCILDPDGGLVKSSMQNIHLQ